MEVERRFAVGPLPDRPPVDLTTTYLDLERVALVVTAGWTKVAHVATREQVRSDPTLWRRMHIEDWDTVPAPLRGEAFDAMLAQYAGVLASPATWDRMRAVDWDDVPQPIRVVAFRHMVDYWSGYYQVGVPYAIPRRIMADTLCAVLMSESWFEHRAVTMNAAGNRDLGLAQASDATRQRMAVLYRMGLVDVRFEDDDYFDPWHATRFLALWMGLVLDEVRGDLDAAIAAYHRGSARAHDERGQVYLAAVQRRFRHLRPDPARPPLAWDDLWARAHAHSPVTTAARHDVVGR